MVTRSILKDLPEIQQFEVTCCYLKLALRPSPGPHETKREEHFVECYDHDVHAEELLDALQVGMASFFGKPVLFRREGRSSLLSSKREDFLVLEA